jgi:hypothetical protein
VSLELNDGMTLVSASNVIFRELNALDLTEWIEPLSDVAFVDSAQNINQATDIDLIVLFTFLLRFLGWERIPKLILILFELRCSCSSVLLSLRCLYHDGLAHELGAREGHS